MVGLLTWPQGKDSRQNEQGETQPGRENKREKNKTTENKNKNIKKKIRLVKGAPLIGKIQSFLASHVLRNLALRCCQESLECFRSPCQKMVLLESYMTFASKSLLRSFRERESATPRGSLSVPSLALCLLFASSST